MAPKKTQTGTDHSSLKMEDIYNLLMAEIEPELTLDMLPLLDELYEDESEDMRKDRAARYAMAFEEFEERFEKAMAMWKQQIRKLRDAALSISRKRMKEEDRDALSDIENSINAA